MLNRQLLTSLLALGASSLVSCAPSSRGASPQAGVSCQNYTIPLTVTSEQYIYNFTHFTNNFDVVNFTTQASSVNASSFFRPVETTPVNQTHSVEIFATFCQPLNKTLGNGDTVLVATHGIGTDGSYWNSPYKPETYNFVDHAAAQGYSVFYYDRVGNGKSTKLSGYVNGLSLQVEVLSQLVKLVKAGQHTGSVGTPKSVVVLGFSFGSVVTNTLVSNEPTLMDGAVFTGLGYSPTAFAPFLEAYQPRIASIQNPQKFGHLDSGALTWVDIFANINSYFKQPNYAIETVEYFEANKQPFTVAEVLSLGYGLGVNPNAQKFTGPVLVVTGEFDFFACAGYCPGQLEEGLAPLFNGSKDLQVSIHPDCGHSINYNLNATGAYEVITTFLHKNAF